MAMTQEQARVRNWTKMRIVGFDLTKRVDIPLTREEKGILVMINNLRLKLLDNWDKNGKTL